MIWVFDLVIAFYDLCGVRGRQPPVAGSQGRQPLAGSKGQSPWLGLSCTKKIFSIKLLY
ncbi:hypothetical protein HanPSC8_Chr17g0778681 [Helianthus annuus]|nr:hypothetical protein HanPSC8_Chr17g0778681 [Helianthus annuus]